jgi:hypothetical protein
MSERRRCDDVARVEKRKTVRFGGSAMVPRQECERVLAKGF